MYTLIVSRIPPRMKSIICSALLYVDILEECHRSLIVV